MIIFPICLSKTKEKVIKISDDVVVKRIDLTFLGRFFQFKFDENNRVINLSADNFKKEILSYLKKTGFLPPKIWGFMETLYDVFPLLSPHSDIDIAVIQSFSGIQNYAIEVSEEKSEHVELLNLSMKLTSITKTGIYVGIYDDLQNIFEEKSVQKSCRIYPRPFYGNFFLNLTMKQEEK